MDSDDLEAWQIEKIQKALGPIQRYLAALKNRIYKRSFPEDDPLRQEIERAYSAIHSLTITLHYMSCEHGVGRLSREAARKRKSERGKR